ncbi:MAG: PilX N-terminal domain-containing pilus assembly protein [Gammaproteobacteria bacterium]|nr:PilX N-terminal domain-containing pilus assembly protein [Gammaproteobacteria bacterium]
MKTIAKQNGAALVVGMVVLLIMTLLGISSMGRTTTELKMATNAQTHNSAFQAAAAALKQVLVKPVVTTVNWDDLTGDVVAYTVTDLTSTEMEVSVAYVGCRLAPAGFSMTGSSGSFKGLIHEVTGTARMINSGGDILGSSTQVLGVQTIRPGC